MPHESMPMAESVTQILITCHRVSGPGGQVTLVPQVDIRHMPHGWDGAFQVLLEALQRVADMRVKQATDQQRVQVAQVVPGTVKH